MVQTHIQLYKFQQNNPTDINVTCLTRQTNWLPSADNANFIWIFFHSNKTMWMPSIRAKLPVWHENEQSCERMPPSISQRRCNFLQRIPRALSLISPLPKRNNYWIITKGNCREKILTLSVSMDTRCLNELKYQCCQSSDLLFNKFDNRQLKSQTVSDRHRKRAPPLCCHPELQYWGKSGLHPTYPPDHQCKAALQHNKPKSDTDWVKVELPRAYLPFGER